MKKLFIVLALLLIAFGAFAEAEVSGEFKLGATNLFTDGMSTGVAKAEINLNAAVDENTSVALELDAEGDDWTETNIALDDFRVTSNLTGALGVDAVDLNVTVGLFDTYFCNWNYVSRNGDEYGNAIGGSIYNDGPTTDLAFAVDLGVADYNIMYWMDFAASVMNVAVKGSPVEAANFAVGYYSEIASFADGSIYVEGGYSFDAGPAALTIPAAFSYGLGDSSVGWSSGVAADVDAYHVATGFGGNNTTAFQDCNIELSTTIVENADIHAIAYLDFSADTAFQSVDLGGQYNFGAFGIGAGYAIASSEAVETGVSGGDFTVTGNGIYLYADVDF